MTEAAIGGKEGKKRTRSGRLYYDPGPSKLNKHSPYGNPGSTKLSIGLEQARWKPGREGQPPEAARGMLKSSALVHRKERIDVREKEACPFR